MYKYLIFVVKIKKKKIPITKKLAGISDHRKSWLKIIFFKKICKNWSKFSTTRKVGWNFSGGRIFRPTFWWPEKYFKKIFFLKIQPRFGWSEKLVENQLFSSYAWPKLCSSSSNTLNLYLPLWICIFIA